MQNNKIYNIFLGFIAILRIKSFFKKRFKKNKYSSSDRKILIEFNAFQSYHVPASYFANYLSEIYESKIVGFFNYKILSSPFEETLLTKIKWIIGNNFNLKTFSLFRSFGVNEIIRPKLDKTQNSKALETYKEIIKNIKNKKDVINIKISEIKIGDLIYDTYIKSKRKPTVYLDEDFYKMVLDFCKLFIFWEEYFKRNKVKSLIGVHTAYSYGLPLRVAIYKKIPTYCVSFRKINRLNKNMQFASGEFLGFKKKISNIEKNKVEEGIEIAKQKLQDRINAKSTGVSVDLISSEIGSFSKNYFKSEILKNKNIKVIIFPHDFFDAVHAYGDILFEDFYEWLEFLGKISNKTDYEWYIKNRPNHPGKFKIYQPMTENLINDFVKKYPKIKKLPNTYPHNQIVEEGINCVLTVYGSVGLEYAYFNIPVINASINNPHGNYNFNLNPRSIEEYEKLILNIKDIKISINKNEIYEYYFMRNIYHSRTWLIKDLVKFIEYVGGWSYMNSYKFYNYWLNNISDEKELKINKTIKNFVSSGDDAINISHIE